MFQKLFHSKVVILKSVSILACASIVQAKRNQHTTYCQQIEIDTMHTSNAESIRKAMELQKDPYDVVDEDEEVEWDIKKDNWYAKTVSFFMIQNV